MKSKSLLKKKRRSVILEHMGKRFFAGALLFFALFCVAADDGEVSNEGALDKNYVEKEERKGEQYFKLGLMPVFPLNFGKKLNVGGGVMVGYYKFLTKTIAIGGEIQGGYCPTIGGNVFGFAPITFGAIWEPIFKRFEFPLGLSLGISYLSSQNRKYFPGFSLKLDAAFYYRFSAGWAIGGGVDFFYLPEWYSKYRGRINENGLFLASYLAIRYYF